MLFESEDQPMMMTKSNIVSLKDIVFIYTYILASFIFSLINSQESGLPDLASLLRK